MTRYLKAFGPLTFAVALLFSAPTARADATKQEVQELLKKGAPIVDVRTPEEFKAGHLQGAVNVPVGELSDRISSVATNKNAPVLVHCQSGGRSASARKKLEAAGYTRVIDLGSLKNAREKTGR